MKDKTGFKLKEPKERCEDIKCPFHGKLKLHGRTFIGVVTSASSQKTAKVEWQRLFYLPKYERYEKRKSKIISYNPICINAKVGDKVKVIETRKISKTKNSVIVEVLKWKQISLK